MEIRSLAYVAGWGAAPPWRREENRELFYMPAFDRVMELVLAGLSRIPRLGN
jgi:hypothetical protein